MSFFPLTTLSLIFLTDFSVLIPSWPAREETLRSSSATKGSSADFTAAKWNAGSDEYTEREKGKDDS